MAESLNPSRALTIGDLRRLAQRRAPRMVFDYIDGGADAEVSLRENCRVFEDVTFRPRGAVATPAVRLDGPAGSARQQPLVLPAR
jgi:L-lactate dehydrogenase (cytochrome)